MFQAQVISCNDTTFSTLCFGQKDQGTLNYLKTRIDNMMTNIGNMGDIGKSFYTSVANSFEEFNGAEALKKARLVLQHVKSAFVADVVYGFDTLQEIQSAGPVMQRYIMANPTVRQLYNDQAIDGYGVSYVDLHPGTIGVDHYDYRRVTEGLIMPYVHPEYEEVDTIMHTYRENLLVGDRDLEFDEQLLVMKTWSLVENYLKHTDEDPTNPSGGTR